MSARQWKFLALNSVPIVPKVHGTGRIKKAPGEIVRGLGLIQMMLNQMRVRRNTGRL
jgi:hypothetical protein